jgi:translation initiation factor eIF-2B subunit gamma
MLPNSLIPNALPKPQFRAVITCGFGSDLYPLIEPVSGISEDEDEAKPAGPGHGRGHGQVKALLPVAGKRMVDWVLDRVEEAGVFGA